MNTIRTVGFVLFIAGILGLLYGSISYVRDTQEAKIGSLVLSVRDKQSINIPVWVGVAGIVLGGGLLVNGYRSKMA